MGDKIHLCDNPHGEWFVTDRRNLLCSAWATESKDAQVFAQYRFPT